MVGSREGGREDHLIALSLTLTCIMYDVITIKAHGIHTSGPTPQVASSAAHMYVCSRKLRDVV